MKSLVLMGHQSHGFDKEFAARFAHVLHTDVLVCPGFWIPKLGNYALLCFNFANSQKPHNFQLLKLLKYSHPTVYNVSI